MKEDPLPPLREEQQQTTTMTHSSVGGEDTRGNEHYEWGGGRGGNHDQDESPEEGGGCHQGGAPCSSSYSNNTGVSLAPATEEHHVEFYPLVREFLKDRILFHFVCSINGQNHFELFGKSPRTSPSSVTISTWPWSRCSLVT